jgi:hypothetical protein
MAEDRRIVMGDRTYELDLWAVADGDVWAFRLLQLAMVGAGATDESETVSMGKLLESVKPEDFIAFRDACLKYTSLVERAEDGEELVRELSKSREAMRGRYADTLAILTAHIQHEFAPFLISAGTILGGGKKKAAAKPGGSSSPGTSTG